MQLEIKIQRKQKMLQIHETFVEQILSTFELFCGTIVLRNNLEGTMNKTKTHETAS